nr:PREDICTED: zinc finger protein STAMENLESS 1-like [Musa acuminata subsp. malaccensis]
MFPFSTLSLERETETLNRARQLVFSNDGAIGLRDPSTGGSQIPPGGFQHRGGSIGEACVQFQPVYPGLPNPPPVSQYLHPSSSSRSLPHPPAYQPPHPHYYIGHVISGSSQRQPRHHGYSPDPSFTCYGAPVSHSFPPVEEGRAPTVRGNQLR